MALVLTEIQLGYYEDSTVCATFTYFSTKSSPSSTCSLVFASLSSSSCGKTHHKSCQSNTAQQKFNFRFQLTSSGSTLKGWSLELQNELQRLFQFEKPTLFQFLVVINFINTLAQKTSFLGYVTFPLMFLKSPDFIWIVTITCTCICMNKWVLQQN